MQIRRKGKLMRDCKQCEESVIDIYGDIGCKILVDWLTHQEYKQKKVLDGCPKEQNKCLNSVKKV